MAELELSDLEPGRDKRFIKLGKRYKKSQVDKIKSRLSDDHLEMGVPWATLGWSDSRDFAPKGKIAFSNYGNKESIGLTEEEIKKVYQFNPLAKGKKFVTERYINFDEVDFGFDKDRIRVDELPELRMTLFLEPEEGAIVFFQMSDKDNHHDEDADIEYILPNSTGSDHNTNRDRLNYFFRIIPGGEWENDPNDAAYLVRKGSESDTSFIIKVLTFERHNLNAEDLLNEGLNQLKLKAKKITDNLVDERYDLLKFDASANDFISHNQNFKIDYSAKTLLLIHGTLSNTKGSFAGLYSRDFDHEDWPTDTEFLKKLIEEGVYDQILAFDHPTILHDAITNSSWLYNYFGNNRFELPVDLIGTSRGAVVCHQLACDKRNKNFTCGQVLSISGGFGVRYFSFAKGVSTLFKIIKKVFPGAGTIVAMIAQFSVDFFLKLPGCRQLTPKSKRLMAITAAPPISTTTEYQNIQVDWHKDLVEGWLKRKGIVILDAMVKLILGKKHDLVVGYSEQGISPYGQSKPPLHLTSTHTKNLHPGFPAQQIRPMIQEFLTE